MREVSDACRRGGIKFGVYLSPWDRHDVRYGQGKAYDDYYVSQLTELATNYGDIFCFWFDGACGEGPNGKKQSYDWQRYFTVLRKLQPNAVLNVCGPDVRWCGNEAGQCRKAEWSVVPAQLRDAKFVAEHSQQTDDGKFSRKISTMDEDLGSRARIRNAETLIWYPSEVDTSIRTGWFYHPAEDNAVRTAEELLTIYLDAVGANASLLLNIPPDTHGRIAALDCEQLAALGQKLRTLFAAPVTACAVVSADSENAAHPAVRAVENNAATFWQAADGRNAAVLTLQFAQPRQISCVVLGEHLPTGQRIESGEIWADGQKLATFTVVGHKRICRFVSTTVQTLTVKITSSRMEPTLRLLEVYR